MLFMRCKICSLSDQETNIYDGIYEGEISPICENCAESENIPLIKKPTEDQITSSEITGTVRDRLEKMSGTRELSKEQTIANKNLAKIKFPQAKQHSEILIDNYYWAIKMARRRKKISIEQLAKSTGISEQTLEELEIGQLPTNFEEIMKKLELVLDVKLLKTHELEPKFVLPERDVQERILAETEEKMKELESKDFLKPEPKPDNEKLEKLRKIESGEFDFSKRRELEDVTLADLQEMKRKRDLKQKFEKEKQEHEELFGDDLEFEEITEDEEELTDWEDEDWEED